MSKGVVELFQKCIDGEFRLKDRKNGNWLLHEDNCEIELKAPSECSFGFSLDKTVPLSPFNFFSASPPAGIIKMCDAMIVLSHKSKSYIFIIEQKTSRKDGYTTQLVNGKYFCDWLLTLLKEHNHYNSNPVFIGLLCWRPREKSPYKGTTRHGEDVRKKRRQLFDRFYEIENREKIRLGELISTNA